MSTTIKQFWLSCTSYSLVRYDGRGLRSDGYFCVFDLISKCHTDTVEFDGAGLRPFVESVPLGERCTGKTFVEFDCAGLRASRYAGRACGKASEIGP